MRALTAARNLAQAQGVEADDPTAAYMLQAGARVCKCLGPDFLPYMELVMPQLLTTAAQQPDVSVTQADADDDDNDDDEDEDVRPPAQAPRTLHSARERLQGASVLTPGTAVHLQTAAALLSLSLWMEGPLLCRWRRCTWGAARSASLPCPALLTNRASAVQVETLYVGGSKISIRTSALDDKANACNMLCCYADELREAFFPWVERVGLPCEMSGLRAWCMQDCKCAAMRTSCGGPSAPELSGWGPISGCVYGTGRIRVWPVLESNFSVPCSCATELQGVWSSQIERGGLQR